MRVACEHSRPHAESVPDSPLAPRTMHVRTTSMSHTFLGQPLQFRHGAASTFHVRVTRVVQEQIGEWGGGRVAGWSGGG